MKNIIFGTIILVAAIAFGVAGCGAAIQAVQDEASQDSIQGIDSTGNPVEITEGQALEGVNEFESEFTTDSSNPPDDTVNVDEDFRAGDVGEAFTLTCNDGNYVPQMKVSRSLTSSNISAGKAQEVARYAIKVADLPSYSTCDLRSRIQLEDGAFSESTVTQLTTGCYASDDFVSNDSEICWDRVYLDGTVVGWSSIGGILSFVDSDLLYTPDAGYQVYLFKDDASNGTLSRIELRIHITKAVGTYDANEGFGMGLTEAPAIIMTNKKVVFLGLGRSGGGPLDTKVCIGAVLDLNTFEAINATSYCGDLFDETTGVGEVFLRWIWTEDSVDLGFSADGSTWSEPDNVEAAQGDLFWPSNVSEFLGLIGTDLNMYVWTAGDTQGAIDSVRFGFER